MARIASMSVQQVESLLGPRGHLLVDSDNRGTVRKWLVANGYPAAFAADCTNRELSNAYNETDGTGLAVLNRKLKLSQESESLGAPINDDIPFTDGSRPSDSLLADSPIVDDALVARMTPPPAVPQTPQQAPDKAKQLLDIIQSIGTLDKDAVESIVESRLTKFRDLLPDFVAACSPVSRIEIQRPDATIHRVEGIVHPQFERLVKLATSRDSAGRVPGIWIAGEASSGKTTGAEMLANALGVAWGCNGAISQPHEMLGFIDGNGHYHTTPFRERFEHGGAYAFDEVDRSDPNALLAVNPHLAGNVAAFPDGMVQRHKDFILIGTANTWGLGGSSDYAGATRLDAAFLSRFPTRLMWNIDENFEVHISGNESWALRVQAARRRARDAGLKVMICSRMTLAGAAHIANGFTPDEAAELTYLANLKPEDRRVVEG